MDLFAITAGAIGAVNPLVCASWQQSTGSITGADGKRTPAFARPVELMVQKQALSGRDLMQLASLNIEGITAAIYIGAQVGGVERPFMKGGDLLTIGANVWLVTAVLEHWPNWTKLAVVMQMPGVATAQPN